MDTEREANARDRVRTIEPELLEQMIRSGCQVTILDLRSTAEFRGPGGRIPGARSVPLYQLPARSGEFASHRSEPVIVVSARGDRARIGALELELAGFAEVQSLAGGMSRWCELGLPVSFASTRPPVNAQPAR